MARDIGIHVDPNVRVNPNIDFDWSSAWRSDGDRSGSRGGGNFVGPTIPSWNASDWGSRSQQYIRDNSGPSWWVDQQEAAAAAATT